MDAPAMTLALVAAFAVGALLGAAHFGSLWWSVVLMRRRPDGTRRRCRRLCASSALALALALIARQGAAPLLAAALGVLAARAFLMRRYRRIA